MIGKEIDLTNKKSEEIIDKYFQLALETQKEFNIYEKNPELIKLYVEEFIKSKTEE